MSESGGWRPVVAALANPHARQVFAQVVLGHAREQLGQGLGTARTRGVIDTLTKAGLVAEVDGRLEVRPEAFTTLLATPRAPRTGPERFLDPRGVITQWPTRADDLRELLAMVAQRVLAPGEVLTEKELNGRLRVLTIDVALLRRHLVDHGLVDRTPTGSAYTRAHA